MDLLTLSHHVPFDIEINGVTQEYRVNVSNFKGATTILAGAKQLLSVHINLID